MDWPGFYAAINRTAPIPVQTVATYQAVTIVADTLVILEDVLAKCAAMTTKPTLISVYADVLQIQRSFTPAMEHGGLVLCARRIEVADGAEMMLNVSSKPTGKVVIFCNEVQGKLQAQVTSALVNATNNIDLSDRTVFGSIISGVDGTAKMQQVANFQDSGLAYGSPLRINVITILQYGMAVFYSYPTVAESMFTYVLRVTNGSTEAKDLYMQASAAMGNLLANASPVTYVPYLDKDVYEQSMSAFITAASTYETQYQRFADQATSAQDRMASAKLLLDNNSDVMGMNAQLIDQATKNLDLAQTAALKANFALQAAQMMTTSAGIAFKYDEKTWARTEIMNAVFSICIALVQFGASLGAMCVGDEAGAASGAKAVEGGAKAAEAAAEAAKSASACAEEAKQIGSLAASMKKIGDVTEKLGKMYEALQKIIDASKDIAAAGNLPDSTLPAGGDLSADPGWDVFVIDTASLLKPAIDAGIPGAQDYLDAVNKQALYGKAYMAAQVSVVTIAQQLVQLQLQQQVNAAQATRLNGFMSDIATTEAHFDEMKQLFFQWELNMRFWVFTIFQQYAWAYRYWALQSSNVAPSIVKTVAQLQQDLATVEQEYAKALASFNPAPQTMHQSVTIPATDIGPYAGVIQAMQTGGTATLPIALSETRFAGLDRVRLTTVRVWLVGVNATENTPVNLNLSTSGFYEDRLKGTNLQFSTQPLTYAFIYQGAVGDVNNITVDGAVDERDRYLYFQPTPFTQWTIKANSPQMDLSKLTAIKMEFAGSVNASSSTAKVS
jgi:hypothetical protein